MTGVENLIKHMHDYQKMNNIVAKCLDNATYLRDCIKLSCPEANVIVRPCYAFIPNYHHSGRPATIVHMVVEADGKVYDPSYETTSDSRQIYFYTFRELHEFIPNIDKKLESSESPNGLKQIKNRKELIQQFIKFRQFADEMTRRPRFTDSVTNCHYYNDQADYIDSVEI
jgi:hypothetical protein